jgi:hypothetical protein
MTVYTYKIPRKNLEFEYINIQTLGQSAVDVFFPINTTGAAELDLKKNTKFEFFLSRNRIIRFVYYFDIIFEISMLVLVKLHKNLYFCILFNKILFSDSKSARKI